MRTVQVSSQTHQDDDSSMNLDVGELCLSELLTSDYFQGHDTGEPYLFNQETMEDWSGGDCDQIDFREKRELARRNRWKVNSAWHEQQERLRNLQQRLKIPFDVTLLDHQDSLRQLWKLAYPNRKLPSLKSELWKEMGWQGPDPSTDFRGDGFISLENLLFCQRLSGRPTSVAGIRFLELLGEDEMAFDNLFCVAFQMMDVQWLAKRASYMEFNDVLKSTRSQLERELALENVSSIKDLPAYNLLKR
ncbi:hypothetical protein AAC387_Pa01g1628 [Persea americana]